MAYKQPFFKSTKLSSRMLKQLIDDWKTQASYGQGTRSYVFSVCANELEEVLESLEAQSHFTNQFKVGKEIDSLQAMNAK